MPVNFQTLKGQIEEMGRQQPAVQKDLQDKLQRALQVLRAYSEDLPAVETRLGVALVGHDELRCAAPASEALAARFPAPPLPPEAVVLAADGSQINPNRHARVEFSLVNVGAVCFPQAKETIKTRLIYHDDLYINGGMISEEVVALRRDLEERRRLVELARDTQGGVVVTLTDGQLELYRTPQRNAEFDHALKDYMEVLRQLRTLSTAAAGYVDRPRSDLVVRLLEILSLPSHEVDQAGRARPFMPLYDRLLFEHVLTEPGDRSAVFAIHSESLKEFTGDLALHFFYLNVGQGQQPYLARVEIPAWVAESRLLLNTLHAVLYSQSRLMSSRPYPYVLHRAHEVAVVTQKDQMEIEDLIVAEMMRNGIWDLRTSNKQSAKDLPGRNMRK
ncbi:MAG TPA: DNA double-strand break repair nuclease NurA [Anaerolineaceae bacterium]|nr:DNA double-strand break repair nuclease NurA [Anaerolineaceae bacterium]HPN51250.1 DNA double-strand break repair nuclease NurA [Anaerolineaceae bacterium]